MREEATQGRRRVTNACLRCRRQKIKCSGTQPCKRCDKRNLECVFGADDKKVMVSESVLQELRNRIGELEHRRHVQPTVETSHSNVVRIAGSRTPPDANHTINGDSPPNGEIEAMISQELPLETDNANLDAHSLEESAEPDIPHIDNPLVAEQPSYLSISGRLRYLGHSSNWSFTQQVLQMAHASPNTRHLPPVTMHVEGEAYKLPVDQLFNITPSALSGLPPLNLSLYYLQSVKFRTNPLFHLFDEQDLTTSVKMFFKGPLTYAQANPYWFIKYLVIMSLGKAFARRGSGRGKTEVVATISPLFMRALQLLPNLAYLAIDPVESTEIVCAIALYLQSLDHRAAAYCYIGQALRLAISHGLHTDIQADTVSDDLVQRCRQIWWTVYILERKFSSSFGAPNSLRDEDITIPLPKPVNGTDEETTAQMLYIRICQMQGRVVSTLYGSQGELNRSFLKTARSILRGAAGLSEELRMFSESCFGEISRCAAHVNLAYHQCVLVTTRPVLYHTLKQRLESFHTSPVQPLSTTMKGLIQICIDSATRVVAILSELREHDLLDCFLPFDLETAASAGLVLAMASNLHPKLSFTQEWFGSLNSVLDSMSEQGNILADQRKAEIETLFSMVTKDEAARSMHSMAFHLDDIGSANVPIIDPSSFPSLGDPFFDEWNLNEALSGGQLMEVAAAMDAGSLSDMDIGSTEMDIGGAGMLWS